jgi:hypothetical protein
MANKRFWMGMLVLTLVFGMTVVGCEEETPEETGPKFKETVTVTQIPGNRNGETFTMALIKNGNTFVTKGGTITGDSATAEFVVEKDLPNSTVLFNDQYTCYLSLKIGDDAAKVSKEELGFTVSTEGTFLGSQSKAYANLFN